MTAPDKALVDELRPYAEKTAGSIRICVTEVRKIVEAFDVLETQARELTSARAEIERLREALEPFARADRALGETPGSDRTFRLETDTGYREIHRDAFRRARSVLENGPAGLADATNDPAEPDLSPLRKGAEVAVKPLEWEYSVGNLPGQEVWSSGDPWMFWIVTNKPGEFIWCESLGFSDMVPSSPVRGSFTTLRAAKSAAQSDFETRIRSALVSGSREDGDG